MKQSADLRFATVGLAVLELSLIFPAANGLPRVSAGSFEQEPTIVRVEEDWELIVSHPDYNSTSPQVSCSISPTGDTNSVYATFELNHHSQPEFAPGGLQLQTWQNETPLVARKFPHSQVLAEDGETITWTQVMNVDADELIFEVIEGHSTTWGTFGGHGQLRSTMTANLTNLNDYSPDTSVQNSGVGFAGNRVESLILKRVRVFTATGSVQEDNAPRIVHTQN